MKSAEVIHRVDRPCGGGVTSKCIEWSKGRTGEGYGQQWHKGKIRYAHRVAYCEANDLDIEDIEGVVVRHKCDNPPCCNPDHLEAGTHADNVRDMMERGRHRAIRVYGEKHGLSKLTKEDVAAMRKAAEEGEPFSSIAERYPVSSDTVSQIVRRKTWRHINGGDSRQRGPKRGEERPGAKLTENRVREIKARYSNGEPGSKIARDLGVSHSTVCDICRGRTWRHVQ